MSPELARVIPAISDCIWFYFSVIRHNHNPVADNDEFIRTKSVGDRKLSNGDLFPIGITVHDPHTFSQSSLFHKDMDISFNALDVQRGSMYYSDSFPGVTLVQTLRVDTGPSATYAVQRCANLLNRAHIVFGGAPYSDEIASPYKISIGAWHNAPKPYRRVVVKAQDIYVDLASTNPIDLQYGFRVHKPNGGDDYDRFWLSADLPDPEDRKVGISATLHLTTVIGHVVEYFDDIQGSGKGEVLDQLHRPHDLDNRS